ncbi:MAG: F0F1 ATP synthase subunit gamma [Dactylosporangium sp.]|nr:F0F1 ATP synthase subunit gamma [Dactylosporangium sp.]NNJ60813.1 F0F1 ATP synthase subunit gamma [Dactylosporangium sp.]
MAGNLLALRRKIRSVTSTRKITKAQELVAASRIGRARERVDAARPYAEAISGVLAELAGTGIDHPLLVRPERVTRAGVLLITSDRGLCGGYNANILRTTGQLVERLRVEGRDPALYVIGRKGVTFYRFRDRPMVGTWTGFSERPTFDDARAVGDAVLADLAAGLQELHLVHTEFRSLITQLPVVRQLAPVELPARPSGPRSAYAFEPEAEALLPALLPRYISARIYAALVESAASESASRRRAMKSATDNADELITVYTRQMNSARQAAITQEISEIVGGANALAAAGSEE